MRYRYGKPPAFLKHYATTHNCYVCMHEWQVTLSDPIWQVMLHSFEMDFLWKAIHTR